MEASEREALDQEQERQQRMQAASGAADAEAQGNLFDAGEYERIKHKPLLPATLAISGLKRTREYIVTRELQELSGARNLDEIKDILLDATQTLTDLDFFEAVSFTIDDDPSLALVRAQSCAKELGSMSSLLTGLLVIQDGADVCRVLLEVKEKPRARVHAGVYAQGNEGVASPSSHCGIQQLSLYCFSCDTHAGVTELSVVMTNLLGVAERTTVAGELGSRHSSEFSASIAKPRLAGYPLELSASVHQQINNCQWISSYTQRLRGASFALTGCVGGCTT